MNPLISIIIPVYNVEKYLDKCVESVVNQTYKNLEILLVDDGSPDNCPQMCDAWAEKDGRVKVMHVENNGVAEARNKALEAAEGDYIGFVDSDDWIEPNMYEYLLKIIEDYDCDISVCSYQINDGSLGDDKIVKLPAVKAINQIALGDYKYGVLWNKLFKKAVVEGVKMPELRYSEDMVFNYFAFKNAETVCESSLALYHYFQNDESTVHRAFDETKFAAVNARKIIIDDVSDGEGKPYAVKGFILSCYVFINDSVKSNTCLESREKARQYILEYKGYVLKSSFFSFKEKIKIVILWLFPKLYNKLISK